MSFGKQIFRFDSTTSTNDEALKRAKTGFDDGEIFIAEEQTAGRGRLQRRWESPKGKNLAISFLLKPNLPITQTPLLTSVAGASTFDAVAHFLPAELRDVLKIKWPNDLYLGDKKIAGILIEMKGTANKIAWVIVGIGIDINSESSDFSPEVQKIATSIKIATGQEINKNNLALKLIASFEKRYLEFCTNGPSTTVQFCDKHSYLKGKLVRIDKSDGKIRGIVQGLDANGYLLVKDQLGKVVPIFAGDVILL